MSARGGAQPELSYIPVDTTIEGSAPPPTIVFLIVSGRVRDGRFTWMFSIGRKYSRSAVAGDFRHRS